MRVAVVLSETSRSTDRRGVWRVETVARRLTARGHDVTVFTTGWWDDGGEEYAEDGVRYRAVTVSRAPASFAARVPALVAAFRPDVVLATPSPPAALASARVGATLARAPLVADWYGDEDADGRFTSIAVRAPHRVVTPSQYVRTRVRERGVPEKRTTVVPDGIDAAAVRAADPRDDADVVAARRLDADANLESFLLGLAELRDRGWRAVVVGDGPERDAYEAQARDLRIDDRVTFVGDLSREERLAYYRGAHAFVQTARREYFPTELQWALACGCVGVVEYQAESGAHELLVGRDRGYRVTSPEEIAAAIEDAGDLDHRTVAPDADQSDWECVVDRYLECVREARA